jgi:hypothetical protein
MGATELQVLWCAGCRAEREFEQPPCVDGHGRDCPELTCIHCGEAVLSPSAFPDLVPRRSRSHAVAS